VNGQYVDKPGTQVDRSAEIAVKDRPRFVSRGGDKLAHALETFKFDATGKVCADVGASTGGFTDCLLQNHAARVYAIDVGYGQLAYPLRADARVVVIERTNARYLERLPEPINLAVADASFISLKLLLPAICKWLTAEADVIALIKPQFEAGKSEVGKGGVVRDPKIHAQVLRNILNFALEQHFGVENLTQSPIKGPAGNIEFLVWLTWGKSPSSTQTSAALIKNTLNR
ncbi:MAG TPA: TlyA family RNA methyltransferase, partial [Verrucomicrobiae bacterium]|nr:TlyA family RNA methyltransferase [Verrucomicrobiae bacterium]